MNEAGFTRKVCARLRARGALVFAVVGGPMQAPGWPDRYVAHPAWQGWLEFKTARGRLAPAQKIVLRALSERGAKAYVMRPSGPETWDGKPAGDPGLEELLR